MAKPKTLSDKALKALQIKYARPSSPFQDFSGPEYCRRIASSVGSAFNVKIVVAASPSRVNMETQIVTLNDGQVRTHGDDFAVGLILHEVGHLKHTPKGKLPQIRDSWHHELHNLLEDVRMEHLVKQEYAGAPYFIDTINNSAVRKITDAASEPCELDDSAAIEQKFYGVIQHAIARAYGTDTSSSFSLNEPLGAAMSEAATKLANFMLASELATSDECIQLSCDARDLMQQFLTKKKPPPTPPQDGKGAPQDSEEQGADKPTAIAGALKASADAAKAADDKQQQDTPAQADYQMTPAADKVRLLQRIENADAPRYSVESNDAGVSTEPHRYEQADAVSRLYAGNLKRKIIAKLRANDRSKIVPQQRRGKLNKRMLAKAVIGNPRVYQKRLQPKRRQYAASVILDTSASMWRGESTYQGTQARIDLAMQASAMMVRTLRSVGVPTSLSIYGTAASERVSHSERYLVPEVSREMADMSRKYYRAGHTCTDEALALQLPKLKKAAHGREQLLIIITDGDVGYRTGTRCRDMIRDAQKRSVIHPFVFHVESNGTLLQDSKRERHIASASELPAAAAELLSKIEFN